MRSYQILLRSLQIQAESEGEKKLAGILRQKFGASHIAVKDVSGQYFLKINGLFALLFNKLPLILSLSNIYPSPGVWVEKVCMWMEWCAPPLQPHHPPP